MSARGPRPTHEIRGVIEDLRGKYIRMGRDSEFRSALDRLLKCNREGALLADRVAFTATGETRGIVVTDGAGGGKTSLVRHALSNHPALRPSGSTPMPSVSITVPSPATMKSVGGEILRATGYPGLAKNRTAHAIWTDVAYRFRALGTAVLWIDEAHDLFPRRSSSEAPEILKTLKSLMQGEGAVIVVLSGVEQLWSSICFDEQVKRRYRKFELPQMSSEGDRDMLWSLLGSFCECAGLEVPERRDLVERLVHAGRQRFGRCIEQMIDAIECALCRGDRKLQLQHFADAFYAQEGCAAGENVFVTPRWSSIDLRARAPLCTA